MSEPSDWIVYILECADQTLYTGITNDLDWSSPTELVHRYS